MGIYDRDYYRREGPSFLDRGQVCKWLIAINVGCFIIQLVTRRGIDLPQGPVFEPGLFTDAFILNVNDVLHGQVWRLLTYAFLHEPGIWQHIVFNMLFLWWFGSDVEDIYGSREFLAIYLVSAFLGGVAFVLSTLAGLNPEYKACLGASGAVTAVMVLCALHYPSRVILLFFIVPVPIWLFVGFQVVQDAFIFLTQQRTSTAVVVHLAGAAFAFAHYKRHWRVLNWWGQLLSFFQQRARPRLRIYREEPRQPAPVAAPLEVDEGDQLEAKLDAVLAKVARYGQGSLSDSERQILLRASEVYKKRRT
jgi:membrane associated rhomboid family serine protease